MPKHNEIRQGLLINAADAKTTLANADVVAIADSEASWKLKKVSVSNLRLAMSQRVAVPASATSPGQPGQWAANSTHIYAYTGDGTTHTWVRSVAASW